MKFCILLIFAFIVLASAQPSAQRHGHRRPPWCPPPIFCFANPCQVKTCPAFPWARCINDDPCDRACTGHFYIGFYRLEDWQCNSRPRRRPHWD